LFYQLYDCYAQFEFLQPVLFPVSESLLMKGAIPSTDSMYVNQGAIVTAAQAKRAISRGRSAINDLGKALETSAMIQRQLP
jgi:hypothetical protein